MCEKEGGWIKEKADTLVASEAQKDSENNERTGMVTRAR